MPVDSSQQLSLAAESTWQEWGLKTPKPKELGCSAGWTLGGQGVSRHKQVIPRCLAWVSPKGQIELAEYGNLYYFLKPKSVTDLCVHNSLAFTL